MMIKSQVKSSARPSGWVGPLLAMLALLAAGCFSPAMAAPPGERISLSMKNTELSEVMEMLSRQQRVNILLNSNVSGQVSFNLYDVDLEKAIRAIAGAAGYAVELRDGSYFIVNHDEAGKYAPDGITVVRSFEIRYAEAEVLEATLRPYLSDYGVLTLVPERRLMIVEDTPEFVERIAVLLADVDRRPTQILIEAKILEITLDDEDSFGLDWSKLFNSDGGEGSGGARGLSSPDSSGFFFNYATPNIEATLTALSARGRVRTLSTPKLLALQNQEASVIIGDRRGYQVTTTINQVTSESIEFLESGVILRVTANVDSLGRVMMDIHPEVSNGTVDANGIPSQTTTEVTTQLIVPAGQTVFIGGLMKHTLSEVSSGVPVLGSLPGIGHLFSSYQKTNVNTETIVLITPYVVNDATEAWNHEQQGIVDTHAQAMRAEQQRMHSEVNKKYPATSVNLSRYPSFKMTTSPLLTGASDKAVEGSDPGRHTLYLFHVYSEADAQHFIASHAGDRQLRYYPAKESGRYVVVYGDFEHASGAAAAITQLPGEIARLRPVVRLLRSIADNHG